MNFFKKCPMRKKLIDIKQESCARFDIILKLNQLIKLRNLNMNILFLGGINKVLLGRIILSTLY